jgi:hypothetical protein
METKTPAARKATRSSVYKALAGTAAPDKTVPPESYLVKRRRLTERLKTLRQESEALSISSAELLSRLT